MVSRFVLGISWLILWVSGLVSWFGVVRLLSWIFRLVLRLVFGLVLRLVFGVVARLLIIGCLISNNGCN
jgi:hypothetical protein